MRLPMLWHWQFRRSKYSTRSHPHSAKSHPHSRSHPHSAGSHLVELLSTLFCGALAEWRGGRFLANRIYLLSEGLRICDWIYTYYRISAKLKQAELLFTVTNAFYLLSVLGGIHSACLADGKGEGCDIYCGLLQILASSTLHEKSKAIHHVVARQLLTEKWLDSPREQIYARMPGRPLRSHSKYSGAKTTRYEARSCKIFNPIYGLNTLIIRWYEPTVR